MFPESDRIVVVGSGPSLLSIEPSDIIQSGVTVIAVNGAIDWLGSADYWFTLDPSQINLVRMRNRVHGCKYVACGPSHFQPPGGVIHLKRNEGQLFGKARAPGGLSESPDAISTGNSAFGALGLAYHMHPRKIVLLGVDGSQERRVDGGVSRSLIHLDALFRTAVPQLKDSDIEVANGSPSSRVTCFPRMAPKEAIAWLQG